MWSNNDSFHQSWRGDKTNGFDRLWQCRTLKPMSSCPREKSCCSRYKTTNINKWLKSKKKRKERKKLEVRVIFFLNELIIIINNINRVKFVCWWFVFIIDTCVKIISETLVIPKELQTFRSSFPHAVFDIGTCAMLWNQLTEVDIRKLKAVVVNWDKWRYWWSWDKQQVSMSH